MRLFLSFLFVFSVLALSAEVLIAENFSEGALPDGWQTVGANAGANWSFPMTNEAGGTNGEAYAVDTPNFSADLIMKSNFIPNVDTPAFTLSFRQFFDAIGSDYWSAKISVVLMSESAEMYTIWSNEDDFLSDFGPELQTFSFIHPFPDAESIMLRFILSRADSYYVYFNAWAVDDILLETSNDVSGTFTASMSPLTIDTNLTVPEGMTLTMNPGVEVQFTSDGSLTVDGHLQINGTGANPVTFTADETLSSSMLDISGTATINGLVVSDILCDESGSVMNADGLSSVILSNCQFDHCESANIGGAMHFENCDVTISDCDFSNCTADDGGAFYANFSSMTISGTDFNSNTAEDGRGGAIYVHSCNIDLSQIEAIGNESTQTGSTFFTSYSSGTMEFMLITGSGFGDGSSVVQISTGSSFTIQRCTFTGCSESGYGILGIYGSGSAVVNSCIFWNNVGDDIDIHATDSSGEIKYCDIEGGQGSIQQGGTLTWGNGNIDEDPLFVGPAGNDFNLTRFSPAINTGDPSFPLDPDGSHVEMGCLYASYPYPLIESIVDVPGDQGRQVYIQWIPTTLSQHYDSNISFSLWRQDLMPGRNAVVIHSPAELPEVIEQPIVMMRDTEAWVFIAQVPCMGFDEYTVIAPTVIDSSSADLNESTFMVYCHTTSDLFPSDPASGYSVDNIAPDTPRGLSLVVSSGEVEVQWDEVSTGTYQGNTYPEINGVWYHVYAGDDPNFDCDQDHYIMTTQQPGIIQSGSGVEKKFYKVVASDQE